MSTKKYKKKHRKTKKGGVLEPKVAVRELSGTKGAPLNKLDLMFIDIIKLLNQYSTDSNNNIHELVNTINGGISVYLANDKAYKNDITEKFKTIENTYSTIRQ